MKKVTSGTWIENPVAGQRVLLVKLPAQTGGSYFEMEYICQPFTGKYAIPPHYHPACTEHFEILRGKARYILGKAEKMAGTGETVIFPPGIEHIHPWSDSNEELHVRMFSEADPPDLASLNANINTGITNFGLARDGKVDKNGLPNLLQQAVCGIKNIPGAVPAGMSPGSARIVIGFLAWVGQLAGYRATYPEYGEV
jgi:quercetin dioxygenase-like cupin family protein